jgi:HEAT repeat protein
MATGDVAVIQQYMRRIYRAVELPRLRSTLSHFGIGLTTAGIVLGAIVATPTPERDSPADPSSKNTVIASVRPVLMRDVTLESGVIFSHLQGDEHLTGLNETLGPGACAFDFDNDGWTDLFLVNGTGQSRYYGSQHWWHLPKGHALYRNTHDGRFEDVSDKAGFTAQSWGMGCTVGDFDNDGNPDLVVTNYGSVSLYKNAGDGKFVDVSAYSGINNREWATSAALADYDGDGLLDIYIVNYLDFQKTMNTYEGNSQYIREFPRQFNSPLYVGTADRLYRNLGSFRFGDVTAEAGLSEASGRGLSAVWLDANRDGRPDLFVANDMGTTNLFYVNLGNGKFRESGLALRLNDAHGAHGVSVGDVNVDAAPDFAVSTVAGEPPAVLLGEMESATQRIFRNRSRQLGIGSDEQTPLGGWGIELADFNNDGALDLFQGSGLPVPDPLTHKIAQGQPNRLWLQDANGKFVDASEFAGPALADTQSSRGIASIDIDNDGRLDVYIANNNDLGQLLRNESSGGHWLGVQLRGTRSNRDAIGAIVTLDVDGARQSRWLTSGGFLSASERRLHFGWSAESTRRKITVIWPSGATEAFSNLPTDSYVSITEGGSARVVNPARANDDHQDIPSLVASRPEYTIDYLGWIAAADPTRATRLLESLIKSSEPSVRAQAVEYARKNKTPEGLSVLISALGDPTAKIRLAALDAVRDHQDEASVRWLLRTFADPDPRVRAAAAEVFAYFYRVEEAVIYRKYLALPHLIRLLTDPDAEVRRSAAHAIGEAKRFEGIDPLLAALDDTDPKVRAEAVCSLGIIRDRKALPQIAAIAADGEQAPLVRAHALIALRRLEALDDADLRRRVNSATQSTSPTVVNDALRMLDAIFENSFQGVVLNRSILIESIVAPPRRAQLLEKADHLTLVRTLAHAADPRVIPILDSLARDPDAKVRSAAFVALLEVDRVRQPGHAENALTDRSFDVRRAMFGAMETRKIRPPASALTRNLSEAEMRPLALAALVRLPDARANTSLLAIANDSRAPGEQRALALRALSVTPGSGPSAEGLLKDRDPVVRAAAVTYWGTRLPFYQQAADLPVPLSDALSDPDRAVMNAGVAVLLSRHEAWARRYARDRLLDVKADLGVRRQIIDHFAQKADAEFDEALVDVAERNDDPLRFPALCALTPTNSEARELLWSVLRNPAERDDRRVAAARLLAKTEVRELLRTIQEG